MAPTDRNNPKRAASSDSDFSMMEFMQTFPDDAACLEWLWRTRYSAGGEHADCPKCGPNRVFKRYGTKQQRQSWNCTHCGAHLHPTAGTIFHKSSTSLHLWFYAMYLMTSTRCGISAKQIERELGVTYKTAWRMMNLIRNELMGDDNQPLSGEVEADETYVGGRRRYGTRGRPRKTDTHKVTVFGMVERQGKVAAMIVPDSSRASLHPNIQKRVLPASTVYTDDWPPYRGLDKQGYRHRRINHSQKVYVVGDTHTNTIEGFWSLVKNGIHGVYHAVSAKHLQGYLNEYTWRYNRRDDRRAMFLSLILRAASV